MKCSHHSGFGISVLLVASLLIAFTVNDGIDVSGVVAAQVESKSDRGKYLVHHVAQCVQCHTPRDQRGALDESRILTGATIPVVGPKFSQPWAAVSVSLDGLGNYDESFVRHLLTHGARPDGTRPKAPMPPFKLNTEDADAVIEYLKSLR